MQDVIDPLAGVVHGTATNVQSVTRRSDVVVAHAVDLNRAEPGDRGLDRADDLRRRIIEAHQETHHAHALAARATDAYEAFLRADTAIVELNKYLKKRPDDRVARDALINMYLNDNRTDEAIALRARYGLADDE